jgi:hypothetical protein
MILKNRVAKSFTHRKINLYRTYALTNNSCYKKITFLTHILQAHKQLLVLLLWLIFIGWFMWQHAQQSLQPPIHDASNYYLKAYNFWTEVHQHKQFNPFNTEPVFRPPGTILMSYPFGFDTKYQGFYFRSIFLPIVLLSLAVIISSYRSELNSRSKWHLVLVAGFLSSLPCFYYFDVSAELPAPVYWGLVDNFLAGVAALAIATTIRSIWTKSIIWLGLAAIISSLCLLIKPAGVLIMMLIGLIWFGLTLLQLKSVWHTPDERKSTILWLLWGIVIFAIPYLIVLTGSFESKYLSSDTLAFGSAAIVIMQTELIPSWSMLLGAIHMGLGYPFVIWFIIMILLVSPYFWKTSIAALSWTKPSLIALAVASCITLVFGIWFWIFGSGGVNQIRYFIPFVLMASILALPAILTVVPTMSDRALMLLSMLMIAPVINMAMLLPQDNASMEWQKWTGVNLTSGVSDPVLDQAQNFVTTIKHEGRNVTLFSMSLGIADSDFQSVFDYAHIAKRPMPIVSILRPVDWQRPSTYRKQEMLDADYWLFQPVRNMGIMQTVLATSLINDLDQETSLFQAWATGLTTKDGVSIVSDTPSARVVRITDPALLESAFDALVAKHHWRSTFIDANPERRFSETELQATLALNPPVLENITFGDQFYLRAVSVSRKEEDVTVRFWWKPLTPLLEKNWFLFIHSIDDQGKIVFNNQVSTRFTRPLSSLDGEFLSEQITFKNPQRNGTHRLAIGFYRPNQPSPIANKGTRDWNNQRVIIPLP